MKSQSYQRRWWRGPSRRWWRRWRRRWWWWRWHRHPLRFLASRSYEKYRWSLCPWGEGREEKENLGGGEKKRRRMCLYTVSWRSANFLALSRPKTFILHRFQNYSTNSLIIVIWWQHSSKEQAHRSGQVPWIPNAQMPACPALTIAPCLNLAHSPETQFCREQITVNHM